jgi:hypothetical protein
MFNFVIHIIAQHMYNVNLFKNIFRTYAAYGVCWDNIQLKVIPPPYFNCEGKIIIAR